MAFLVTPGMETSVSPRAPSARHAADAYATVAAWRAPSARRFSPTPANDWRAEVERSRIQAASRPAEWDLGGPLSDWVVPVAGAVLAAVMGAGIGAWLQVY